MVRSLTLRNMFDVYPSQDETHSEKAGLERTSCLSPTPGSARNFEIESSCLISSSVLRAFVPDHRKRRCNCDLRLTRQDIRLSGFETNNLVISVSIVSKRIRHLGATASMALTKLLETPPGDTPL